MTLQPKPGSPIIAVGAKVRNICKWPVVHSFTVWHQTYQSGHPQSQENGSSALRLSGTQKDSRYSWHVSFHWTEIGKRLWFQDPFILNLELKKLLNICAPDLQRTSSGFIPGQPKTGSDMSNNKIYEVMGSFRTSSECSEAHHDQLLIPWRWFHLQPPADESGPHRKDCQGVICVKTVQQLFVPQVWSSNYCWVKKKPFAWEKTI